MRFHGTMPSTLLLGLMLAASLAPNLAHAEVDALVRDALAMTEKGQAKEAFALLSAQEEKRAGDPDFDTVLGIAANEAGEFPRAIFALERVLAVQPDNARARAELGRALFAVGDNKGARALLQQTKTQGIPVEAARTIDQFLQAIDKVEEAGQSSWKGYAEAGVGSDNNINSGITSSNIAVPAFQAPGVLFALSPSGIKTSASFLTAGAGISGRKVIDSRWSLIGNAATVVRDNSGGNSAFNTTQTDISAGGAYRLEKNDYSLVAAYGNSGVGGSTARTSSGLVGEWTYRFDGFRQVTTYGQWSRLDYPQPGQSVRNSNRSVLGSTYAHLFRNSLLAYGGAYIGNEKVNGAYPWLGQNFWGLRGGLQKSITVNLAWFVTLGYENRNFGGQDQLFNVTRQDRQTNLNIGLTWSPAPFWRVTPQIAFTRAASNIVIDDYSRRMISIVARREF